jgi:hypothetical protein
MEFATEMIIKAGIYRANVVEIPITLWPDGRKTHPPHLKTFRDGWRTLRFYLTYSPRWLFLYPGLVSILLGLIGYAIALPGLTIGGLTFDAHTLLFASLAVLIGYQSSLFAIFSKLFAIGEGLLPEDPRLMRFFESGDAGTWNHHRRLLAYRWLFSSLRSIESVAHGRLWPSGLLSDNALGDSRRHAHNAWISNRPQQLFRKYPADAAPQRPFHAYLIA